MMIEDDEREEYAFCRTDNYCDGDVNTYISLFFLPSLAVMSVIGLWKDFYLWFKRKWKKSLSSEVMN